MPFDRWEMYRIVGVVGMMGWVGWQTKGKWAEWGRDSWTKLLGLQLGLYYLVVAVGRAQYGVGIMRAERYGYLGLILTLLILARMGRSFEVKKWMVGAGVVIVGLQCVGLWQRAEFYKQRPQRLRELMVHLEKSGWAGVAEEEYLPHFVLNDERLRYGEIKPLFER